MKLLLDTHIWLWSAAGSPRLGRAMLRAVRSSRNELWLSPLSIWEALQLEARGRLQLRGTVAELVEHSFRAGGFREAVLTREVSLATASLPPAHRDPVDRMLAATAQVQGLTLATADRALLAWGSAFCLANA